MKIQTRAGKYPAADMMSGPLSQTHARRCQTCYLIPVPKSLPVPLAAKAIDLFFGYGAAHTGKCKSANRKFKTYVFMGVAHSQKSDARAVEYVGGNHGDNRLPAGSFRYWALRQD
jgi:hypothetical protein